MEKTQSKIILYISLILLCSALVNAFRFSNALYTGNIPQSFIKPMYDFMISPKDLPDNAGEKMGADFMALYFSAKGYNETGIMYDAKFDPWGRPAYTFPPNLIYLTSLLVKNFDFPTLAIFNVYFQIGFFILVSIYFMRQKNVSLNIQFLSISLILFLVFCTTVGLGFFERSETDLYTGIALLFFIKGMLDEKWYDFLLAGIFLSFKWSGIPYFFFLTLIYLFNDKLSIKKIFNLFLAASPTFIVCLPFLNNTLLYLKEIQTFELVNRPDGISLAKHYPRFIAKILPLIQAGLFIYCLKLKKLSKDQTVSIELLFICLFFYVCAGFGTFAFEYRTMALLALIPFLCSNQLIFSKLNFNFFNKTYLFWFIVFLIYIFKIETNLEFINSVISYKRGRLPFNLLTILLIYYIYKQYKTKSLKTNLG